MIRDEFTQLFGTSDLFVEPIAFRAWLAKAKVKAAALTHADTVQQAMTVFAQRPLTPTLINDIAVIEVNGPITYKSSWLSYFFGGACIQDLQQQFRAALADSAVKTIVLKMDSPGGVVDMVPEFADELFAGRTVKPILAVADPLIASAAYWLASQATAIYASVSAQLGSIGVYCEHDDISAMLEKAGIKVTLIAHGDHKVDGNSYEPLSDAVRADLQTRVDETGDWFDTAVARGRGVKKSVVVDTFGQGKVFRGKEAIALGLADKAGTFGQVVGKLTKGRATVAQAEPPAMLAGRPERHMGDQSCPDCDPDCPCEQEDGPCPPECPTCCPECACLKATAKAKADAAQSAVEQEHLAIVIALSK